MSGIIDILQDVLDSGENKVDELIYKPIPPGDFYMSEYYCGMPRNMIPKFWLDEAVDFIEGGYNELIVTGSLGSLKTTWSNMILLYKIYDLFSHKSIHSYLGLPAISDIYNIYFSVSLTQSMLTGFRQFRNIVDGSRWFKENAPRNTHLSSMIEFIKNKKFGVFSGSGHQHAIGMTVWSFILDEGDFFKKNGVGFDESYEHVTNMYSQLIDRRVSRFNEKEQTNSFSILVSSASYQSSFVEKRIAEAAHDSKVKVIKAVKYKVLPDKFSKETFCVFSGNSMTDPEIMDTSKDINNLLSKIGISQIVDEKLDVINAFETLSADVRLQFELPPVDLIKNFRKNLGLALQNFCGVYVAGEDKLFRSKTLLFSAYDVNLKHPFSQQKIELSNGDKVKLQDYFIEGYLRDITKPHAIHIDGSYAGDSTGISMVRYDGIKGNTKSYTQVFSLEIVPPPAPLKIKLSKIRDFILYLHKDVGVNIVKVTMDQFQSQDSLQLMADEGLNTGRQSIDKSDSTYLSWIGLLVDQAVHHYRYMVLEDEAFAAVHYIRKHKVDHPKKGNININVLQSFVGALENLVTLEQQDLTSGDYPDLKDQSYHKERKQDLLKEITGSRKFSNNAISDLFKMKKQNRILEEITETND